MRSSALPVAVFVLILGLLVVHLGLGFLPRRSYAASAYALIVLIGAVAVVLARREPVWALGAAAYIVGAEVLWRATRVGLFWETGKYAVCLVLLLALIRQNRFRIATVPLAYFLLLLPAAVVTLVSQDWYVARRMVSANLSGPLAVLVCCTYCRGLSLSRSQLIAVLICLLLPLVAVAARAAIGIATTDVQWGTESNWGSSGGFGPNQVSAMLGLGGFASLAVAVLGAAHWQRLVFGVLALWFASQSALTFSRTGFYLLCVSAFAAGLFFLKDRRTRLQFLAIGLGAVLVAAFVIYPALDALTGGNLTTRFSETHMSNRKEIALADLRVWSQNLLLGSGAGQATFGRAEVGFEATAAHTEYTRQLAEHGLLGLAALCLLLSIPTAAFLTQQSASRGFAVGCIIWGLAFLAVSAMRLAAPSFLLGLCCARFVLQATGLRRIKAGRPLVRHSAAWKFASLPR